MPAAAACRAVRQKRSMAAKPYPVFPFTQPFAAAPPNKKRAEDYPAFSSLHRTAMRLCPPNVQVNSVSSQSPDSICCTSPAPSVYPKRVLCPFHVRQRHRAAAFCIHGRIPPLCFILLLPAFPHHCPDNQHDEQESKHRAERNQELGAPAQASCQLA